MIHVKRFFQPTKPDIANSHSPKKQNDLQALEILHLDTIQIRFVQGHLAQSLEDGDGDTGFLHAAIILVF